MYKSKNLYQQINKTPVLFCCILVSFSSSLYAQVYNETSGDRAGNDITTGDYNVIIGDAAGRTIDSESRNVIMGYRACVGTLDTDPVTGDQGDGASDEITTQDCDPRNGVIIGYRAGVEMTQGDDVVIIGAEAGSKNSATDNTFVGTSAGANNTFGYDNTFIGEEAGLENINGDDNTFVGEDAGRNNTTANLNTALGSAALSANKIGQYNTAVGGNAGLNIGLSDSNSVRNTVVGQAAGRDIRDGIANTCIGDNACPHTEQSDFNTFVGTMAGFDNNRVDSEEAHRNTGLGTYAGYTNRTGSDNVWIGAFSDSGRYVSQLNHDAEVAHLQTAPAWSPNSNGSFFGSNNSIFRTTVVGTFASAGDNDSVAIGYNSRADSTRSISIGNSSNASFTNSMAIGTEAITKSNNSIVIGNDNHTLLSANADSTLALGSAAYRYANVVTNQVSVNATSGTAARIELAADSGAGDDDIWSLNAADSGDFSITSFATGADVNLFSLDNTGDATLTGDLTLNSDRRLKTDINDIENAFSLIGELQGKTYHWKDTSRGTDLHYGLIAQEVEAYLPELVGEDDQGMKTVNYQGIVPVLISAVNQTQQEKKQLESRVLLLEKKLERQSELIHELMDRME
ncbi:MAG: tail fiber domain-containing protein [Marinicella sp.]